MLDPSKNGNGKNGSLKGHALRDAHLRQRSLARAQSAPPLAAKIVQIRAETLGMTRLEFCRRSGINRGTLRDLELGVHTPTRRILQQFFDFCQERKVGLDQIEEVRRIYAGMDDTLEHFIARLELRAGSPRELAKRVGISPATLWEYRRGNFPLPIGLLRRLCKSVGTESAPAEELWHGYERRRLLDRGYPEALAEFWVLCARAGWAERHLLQRGLSSATARKLRYLEVPPWPEVDAVARQLCADDRELTHLKRLWSKSQQEQEHTLQDGFGPRLKKLRKQLGIRRRELADLFGIGGKKPARIIKHIEEDGFYSAQAYPAGLGAVLSDDPHKQKQLLQLWMKRRLQFHRRHRPEMRIDLRLHRELYGFGLGDMEAILGYSPLEYQRIERGVSPLQETARARILQAIDQAGARRLEQLLQHRQQRHEERRAWESPGTAAALIKLLARREGGLIPLMRHLKKLGLKGLWTGRLRAIAQGTEVPPWHVLERIGLACEVPDLSQAHLDWAERFRVQLKPRCSSPLGIELRLLIAEVAPTLRAFSPRLGFNYSVLVRDLQRIDNDRHVRWFHVERILKAVGVPPDDGRWREVHALWYTAAERNKQHSENKHHNNGMLKRRETP